MVKVKRRCWAPTMDGFFFFLSRNSGEKVGGLLRLEKGFPKIPSIFDSRRIRHVNQKWSLIDSNVELNLIIV